MFSNVCPLPSPCQSKLVRLVIDIVYTFVPGRFKYQFAQSMIGITGIGFCDAAGYHAARVAKVPESGIIKPHKKPGCESDMQFIGKIDVNIYQCVTPEIATDEVVITDERIQHIEERHPGHFERIQPYLPEIIVNPDYILENVPNTCLLLKRIEDKTLRTQVVLRLHTSNDPSEFKNSIISAWEISETRWNNYVRNKNILYKRE